MNIIKLTLREIKILEKNQPRQRNEKESQRSMFDKFHARVTTSSDTNTPCL